MLHRMLPVITTPDQAVCHTIAQVDSDAHKLALSLRALQPLSDYKNDSNVKPGGSLLLHQTVAAVGAHMPMTVYACTDTVALYCTIGTPLRLTPRRNASVCCVWVARLQGCPACASRQRCLAG